MTDSIWDTPELSAGGDFFKFDNVGTSITGTIQAIKVHRWPDNKVSPQIYILKDDGEEEVVTAGQIQLQIKLKELRPNIGDRIKITFTEEEKRPMGKTLKHFDVQVKAANAVSFGNSVASPSPSPMAAATAVLTEKLGAVPADF
jgi:hypothetical protein